MGGSKIMTRLIFDVVEWVLSKIKFDSILTHIIAHILQVLMR